MEKQVGHYSFVIGVIIALLLGVATPYLGGITVGWLTSLLVVLGLIVGFLNVSHQESKEFVLLATVLVITAGMGSAGDTLASVGFIGIFLRDVFVQLLAFVVPATIIVALKGVLQLARVDEVPSKSTKRRRK
jgi:hypothetical protein